MNPTPGREAATILTAARDLIREYGWIQGAYGDYGSGFCATGALNRAEREHYGPMYTSLPQVCAEPTPQAVVDAMLTALWYALNDHPANIPHWNDAPDRTIGDVIELFDRAIDKLKEVDGTDAEMPMRVFL